MKDIKKYYGDWALVAGAAEGLGEAYSYALANRGLNLIMVDHQESVMHLLADRLEKEKGISTRRIYLDLSEGNAVDRMMEVIREAGCRLIIYNAAYSRVRGFTGNTREDMEKYVDVNVRSPLLLVHAFSTLYINPDENRKGILLMSSLAGLWGTKLLGPYGATKAFSRILAESLHTELKPLNIDVMTCIAGATATPAYLGTDPKYSRIKPSVMNPAVVAEGALNAMGKRALYVPGLNNKLTYALLSRLMPRRTTVQLFNRTVGQMYRDK